jgi:hypothetical protein
MVIKEIDGGTHDELMEEELRWAVEKHQRAGFTFEGEEPHHSYGRDLVSHWWSVELNAARATMDS